MNILQITIQAPGSRSGGEIGVRQTLLSLLANGYEVDYAGPEIAEIDIRKKYRRLYELEPSSNTLLRIWDTLHGNTNQRYRSWKKLAAVLDFEQYDAIVLDFTKLDYVLEEVPNHKVIVRAHNVESDYSARNYAYHPSAANLLDKYLAAKREKRIVEQTRNLICLTREDAARFEELYGIAEEQIWIDPVCIEFPNNRVEISDFETPETIDNNAFEKENEKKPFTILLTGSLWFGPNYKGVKWFLEEVCPALTFPKRILVAGARPNEELKQIAAGMPDCEIIDTPPEMAPYFEQADLYAAPIFDGAGMKVKVAEALAYGLPVVGTKHAFTGYDVNEGGSLICADDAEAFARAVNSCAAMDCKQFAALRQAAVNEFKRSYSIERSAAVSSAQIRLPLSLTS